MDYLKQNKLKDFVNREVMICQSHLIDEMLKKEVFSYDDLINQFKTDEEIKDDIGDDVDVQRVRDRGEDRNEVFEWWLVSDWLLDKLEAKGEVVLRNDFGEWWGRGTTGQAIYLDGVIEEIYNGL